MKVFGHDCLLILRLCPLASSQATSPSTQGCQFCVLKNSENSTKCLMYALPLAIDLPRNRRCQREGAILLFLSGLTGICLQNRVKMLEF